MKWEGGWIDIPFDREKKIGSLLSTVVVWGSIQRAYRQQYVYIAG